MKRYSTPLITPSMIPALCPALRDPSSVFNPGALEDGDEDLLLLRVQDRGRRTHLLPAWHDRAGLIRFGDELFSLDWIRDLPWPVYHAYDARLTRLEGRIHVCLALDTDQGCRSAVLRWSPGEGPELVAVPEKVDTRNCVLFPERGAGRYLRLSRPNTPPVRPGDPASGSMIQLDESQNLKEWKPVAEVIRGRFHYWDELIGAGPPPLLTDEGWLLVYHGVATHFAAGNIYQAGVLLMDRSNPSRLLARGPMNVLEPRLDWERSGQVPNVVFPSGLCVDAVGEIAGRDTPFRLYYGAADTVVGLLEGTVGELLDELEACPQ